MEKPEYFSFLLCHHKDVIHFYHNGLDLGEIRSGIFTVSPRLKSVHDLAQPHPFESMGALKEKITQLIGQLDFTVLDENEA